MAKVASKSPFQAEEFPELMCRCGQRCIVRESRSERNSGRYYYQCPKWPTSEKCENFVQWCDEVGKIQSQVAKSLAKLGQHCGTAGVQYPECMCTAGLCRVETMQSGEFKGCRYFVCHLKTGKGACEHFEFVDSPIDVTKKVTEGMNITTSNPGATKENDNTVVLPASSALGGEVADNHAGSGSTGVKRPNSPEESPSKRECLDEWENEYIVSPTFSCYVTANELDIRYDDLLDEEAKSPQMDIGRVEEHIHIESEETIAPKSPVLPRTTKNIRVPYFPIRMLSFAEDSPRNPTCLVCGGSHETEECIPLELL